MTQQYHEDRVFVKVTIVCKVTQSETQMSRAFCDDSTELRPLIHHVLTSNLSLEKCEALLCTLRLLEYRSDVRSTCKRVLTFHGDCDCKALCLYRNIILSDISNVFFRTEAAA